jgi:hypothetical protein
MHRNKEKSPKSCPVLEQSANQSGDREVVEGALERNLLARNYKLVYYADTLFNH